MNFKRWRKSLLNLITSADNRFIFMARHGFYKNMDDEAYLKKKFKAKMGYELDLSNPQTFNEKLQWLKLHDRKPIYTTMVDKYAVKEYVANIIGEEYIIPTLGVWNKVEDIDFDSLPNQFVLKCTHDSSGVVICKDKSAFDIKAAKMKLNKCLKRNYYYSSREWPYKNVNRKIIAEKYLEDESAKELKDYKVFNFNGEPKLIQVDYNRFVEHKRNVYTPLWEKIEMEINYPCDKTVEIPRPQKLAEMLELSCALSKGTNFLRTDFYSIEDKLYFGELTFYPEAGFAGFTPDKWNLELGRWIQLTSKERI